MCCTWRVIPEPLAAYFENGSPFNVLKQGSRIRPFDLVFKGWLWQLSADWTNCVWGCGAESVEGRPFERPLRRSQWAVATPQSDLGRRSWMDAEKNQFNRCCWGICANDAGSWPPQVNREDAPRGPPTVLTIQLMDQMTSEPFPTGWLSNLIWKSSDTYAIFHIMVMTWDFPGCPVVKNLSCKAGM